MEKENPSFYAILPAPVRYAKDLSEFQKLLYAEITALAQKDGYCYAWNKYFSNLYWKTPQRISAAINKMAELEYIKIEYDKESWNVRKIFIGELKKLRWSLKVAIKEKFNTPIKEKLNRGYSRKVEDPIKEKLNTPIKEKFKHNNINNNNTSITSSSSEEEPKVENFKNEISEKNSSLEKIEEKEKNSAEKEKEIELIRYWNEEINQCMDLIKKYNNGIVDWSEKKQRQFANHLIKKLKVVEQERQERLKAEWKSFKPFTWQETLEALIRIIYNNQIYPQYWS